MEKRGDGLTREQRALRDGMLEIAREQGLEVHAGEPCEAPSNELILRSGEIAEFEKTSRTARIIVGQHTYAKYDDFLEYMHKEVDDFIGRILKLNKKTKNPALVFKGNYQQNPAYAF